MTEQATDDAALLQELDSARRFEELRSADALTVQPDSELGVDDQQSHPYEVSHAAWNALMVSVDHVGCLHDSVRIAPVGVEARAGAIPLTIRIHAQFSLIRGALENAARAVWLLGPDDRLQRLERRLRLQVSEAKDANGLRELLLGDSGTPAAQARIEALKGRRTALIEQLVGAGADAETAAAAVKESATNTLIVREAGEATPIGGQEALVAWKMCSSLAHGDLIGSAVLTERTKISEADDVTTNLLTGNVPVMLFGVKRALVMLDHGVSLYRQRASASAAA